MTDPASVPIAIIGIGCRFPGNVTDTESLWRLLAEGKSAWSPAPADRYNADTFYHPKSDNNGTTNHKGGHFLAENVAAFDAAFFGISPLEAQAMDPQQRLLLEVSYEAFENAGVPIDDVRGSDTAVYAAVFTKDYDRNLYRDTSDIPKYHTTGTGEAIISNRISYTFNLNGPSMTIDTGCSGSMVALHQACQSIRTRESSMALACGVNLILNPDHMIGMSNLGMLNDDGRSYSFDARGSGYGRGEGVSAVLLKRLDEALKAGDTIRAIVRSSGVNQDGKTNGITLPNPQAQEALMRSVYKTADLDPHKTCYIEAHGTGTSAGDLAELESIAKVFNRQKSRHSKLYVGSVKSNIGHLESSSGLAGLIKTVVVLEKGLIPPNADFQTPKEILKLEEWNMIIPTALEPWPDNGNIRRASVNSFGYGGTNSHVILESSPNMNPSRWHEVAHMLPVSGDDTDSRTDNGSNGQWRPNVRSSQGSKLSEKVDVGEETTPVSHTTGTDTRIKANGRTKSESTNDGCMEIAKGPIKEGREADKGRPDESSTDCSLQATLRPDAMSQLFIITAKSEPSTLKLAAKLKEWAKTNLDYKNFSSNLAYSLSSRRSILQWRYSFVADSHTELLAALDSKKLRPVKALENPQATFVFTGQGAQWPAMGCGLIYTHSAFSASLTRSDTILRDLGADWSLVDELQRDETDSRIHDGGIAQPASTALQIALVDLLVSLGVKPRLVVGHSSGEIAAAYAADVLTHDVALRVSYCRSFVPRICKEIIPTQGAMVSVAIGEQDIMPLIANLKGGTVSVACVNSPSNTTLSGDDEAILEVQRELDEKNVFNRKLKVDTAYHSHHMQKVAEQYCAKLGTIPTQQRNEKVNFISSVTGQKKSDDFGAAYWVENLVSKVRFCDAIQEWSQVRNEEVLPTGGKSTDIIIEIGPHGVLGGPIQQSIHTDPGNYGYEYFSTLVRGRDANRSILDLVGKLFEQGYPVDVAKANSMNSLHAQRHFVTGLPTYPWDHSNEYWHESRLSRDYRMREHPPHDLVGIRVPSSTPLEPSWRHIITLDALPWLKDHVIDGLVVFPGSGYLCMAIEAVRQLTMSNTPDRANEKFVLQQISFSKALVIPSTSAKIELLMNIRIQPSAETNWYEFRIFAFSPEDVWHQHCSGRIMLDSAVRSFRTNGLVAEPKDSGDFESMTLNEITTSDYSELVSSEALYSQLSSRGNIYGPSFAAMTDLRMGKGRAIGHIRIPNVQSIMPAAYQQPHCIHPNTLDALMHSVLPLYAQDHPPGSIMPVSIHEVTISADIPCVPGEELLANTSVSPLGPEAARADIDVFSLNGESKEAVLTISQLEILGMVPLENPNQSSPIKQNIACEMKFAPDIDYFPSKSAERPGRLRLVDYLQLLGFKYSQIVVLEVGAAKGQSTLQTICDLQGNGSNSLKRYDLTDMTSESFKEAKTLLHEWEGIIRYQVFNPGVEPFKQGFDKESYDLIIINDVSRFDNDLSATLANIRPLMRPWGRLVIRFSGKRSTCAQREDVKTLDHLQLCFGVTDIRGNLQPVVGDDLLRNAGLCFESCLEDASTKIAISARSAPAERGILTTPVSLIVEDGCESFAALLDSALKDHGFTTDSECNSRDANAKTSHVSSGSPTAKRETVIVLDNGARPYLSNLTQERFSKITQILGLQSTVFWITTQPDEAANMNPEKGLAAGLIRSSLAENDHLKAVILDIQQGIGNCSKDVIKKVVDLLYTHLGNAGHRDPVHEFEYIYRDGQLLVPRLLPLEVGNNVLGQAPTRSITKKPYVLTQSCLKLDLDMTAATEGFHFIENEWTQAQLADDEVDIAVNVHALDTSQTQELSSVGRVPVVHEMAGIICASGSHRLGKSKIGNRVCAWVLGGQPLPNRVRVNAGCVAYLPDSIPLAVGAAMPLAVMAAFYAIQKFARLRKGQVLLINGADSDVGQAALNIAHYTGLEVIAIFSDAARQTAGVKHHRLPVNRSFTIEDPFIAREVLNLTGGQGADMVLNTRNNDALFGISPCVGALGTIVQVGEPWNPAAASSQCSLAGKNAMMVVLDVPSLIRDRPLEARGLLSDAMEIIGRSDFRAFENVTEISMAEAGDAFRQLRGQKRFGRLLLTADEATQVSVLDIGAAGPEGIRDRLNAHGTYIVAGGLGSLGQKICLLMAQRGAKTIVILSRRSISIDDHRSLEERLQCWSHGVRIVSIASDISSRPFVDEAVQQMKMLDLPPVRGVFQSATVLKDGVLDTMTYDDFQVPLQTKLYGTHNLSEAFKDAPLDFFIMLSSLSGVVGSRGQSSYAAGNTFQDALAHSQRDSKTHYMALNLGMIEGTDAYEDSVGQARIKNLRRQGWSPVKNEELLALLKYAMSPLARDHTCHQIAIGIDGTSIHEADNPTPTMRSALFTHVRATSSEIKTASKDIKDESVKGKIEAVEDPADIPQIIAEAVSQRLSGIILLKSNDIDVEAPILNLGLDSLTAVELKNWIQKEIEAPIQASEILDALSINSLSMKLAARSTLAPGPQSQTQGQNNGRYDQSRANVKTSPRESVIDRPTSSDEEKDLTSRVYLNGESKDAPVALPRLPLPKLNDSLELYLKSAQTFLSIRELEATSIAIRNFHDSSGQLLQDRLSAREQDSEIDSWQHDLQVRAVYLSRRDPIHPYGTFYGSHPTTDPRHSQAERAAVISAAAYEFKQRLDTGEIVQDYLNEEPLCMESLKWLFNASREPGIDVDTVAQHPENNYLVALRHGYVFKIMLQRDGQDEPYLALKSEFEAVLEHSVDTQPSIVALSADERNSWARNGDHVTSLSAENDALVKMIDAAAFVLCLDDDTPATATERSNQLLLGNPGNRWSDKSLQFVVCANGASGFICEHSMLDAASLKQLNQALTHAIVEHRVDQSYDDLANGHINAVDVYTFTTDQETLDNIARVQEDFARRHVPIEVSHLDLQAIGSRLLQRHKVPSKAGVQAIIQLASLFYYRTQHPSWETVTMMPFYKGRLDWMQVVSPEMYAFPKAAADAHTSSTDLQRLLREATQTHASTLTRIARGRGFAAHLEALREVVQKDEPVPELFKDPTWEMMRVTSTRKVKTDASEGLMAPEAGFYMPDSESVLVHYEIEEEQCKFFVQSTEGRTSLFCEALEKAATVVKGILG